MKHRKRKALSAFEALRMSTSLCHQIKGGTGGEHENTSFIIIEQIIEV
ncbi:MAG: hypothetical protein AAFP19_02600 [Bacteroidota bacterium]